MKRIAILCSLGAFALMAHAQTPGWQPDLTVQQTYVLHRASSADPKGANADYRHVEPGATETVLDADGPGEVSHIWFTIADNEPYHLKRIVLRIYWDGEKSPSVEAPIGDFFGLGLGEYHSWHSEMLSVGSVKSLNSFFPMPFAHHARITVTNEGKEPIDSLYYNIDYRTYDHPLPAGHALLPRAIPPVAAQSRLDHRLEDQRRSPGQQQAQPRRQRQLRLVRGQGPRTICRRHHVRAAEPGHVVGRRRRHVLHRRRQHAIHHRHRHGRLLPRRMGLRRRALLLSRYTARPSSATELAGSRSSVYRFHLDSPIPFTKSFKATIEHGHANARSDNFYSVAYWYQAEPHEPFPSLPPVDERLPALQPTGGPGSSTASH